MKFTLALLCLMLGSNVFAQQTTENVSTESVILTTLRNSNIGLSIANEIYSKTKDSKINGFYNTIDAYLTYKLSPNDTFKLSAGYNVSDTNLTTASWDPSAPSLRYKRSNILKEEDNFVTFNSEARIYFYSN